MPHIQQIEIDDVLSGLPDMEPLPDQLDEFGQSLVLIAAAGFEDRAREVFNRVYPSMLEQLLLITYSTNPQDNADALSQFQSWGAETTVTEIEYDRTKFVERLRACLGHYRHNANVTVVVDITGMSSYSIYPVIYSLLEILDNARLVIVYVEATHYFPSQDEWNEFLGSISDVTDPLELSEQYQQVSFQSKGVGAVYGSELFPGRNAGPLATQVVAIPSFGLERMKAMCAYAETQYSVTNDQTRWLLGKPPNQQRNGWRLKALMDLYHADSPENTMAISTSSFAETLRVLEDIWQESHLERHTVIATVGSKMQHIATFLFLTMRPDVGLILSEPSEFVASKYSSGVGTSWYLNFGQIGDLKQRLSRIGQLDFHW